MLARVFAAEVDAALSDQPLRRLVQTRSRVAAQLAEDGYLVLDRVTVGAGSRFPVVVTGYVLTEAGRLAYCISAGEA